MDKKFNYKRVLLKLSGEFLQGNSSGQIFDESTLKELAEQLKLIQSEGVQVGIVVGGGNIFRGGRSPLAFCLDRCSADTIGMTATLINAFALEAILKKSNVPNSVYGSFQVGSFIKPFELKSVLKDLDDKKVVIFAGGTGHPFFSTDTAAAVRAKEINADILLKATNVDGVYNKDPHKNSDAIKLDDLDYNTALKEGYNVMDACAFALCKETAMPIFVFNILKKNSIINAVKQKIEGTLITK